MAEPATLRVLRTLKDISSREVKTVDYVRLDYMTCDNSMRFDFVFMDCGPSIGWRVYIINNIDYRGRNTSAHATHRLHASGETYKYICWLGRINTLEEAKKIVGVWGDVTAIRIRTGEDFDEIVKRI
jgi:hypothetical protein